MVLAQQRGMGTLVFREFLAFSGLEFPSAEFSFPTVFTQSAGLVLLLLGPASLHSFLCLPVVPGLL